MKINKNVTIICLDFNDVDTTFKEMPFFKVGLAQINLSFEQRKELSKADIIIFKDNREDSLNKNSIKILKSPYDEN